MGSRFLREFANFVKTALRQLAPIRDEDNWMSPCVCRLCFSFLCDFGPPGSADGRLIELSSGGVSKVC